uniref:Uncharacterized protein n=1 Tax=Glossina brevipalpis TaxID=37001 RepID=A0A1A9W9U8_9MUSC
MNFPHEKTCRELSCHNMFPCQRHYHDDINATVAANIVITVVSPLMTKCWLCMVTRLWLKSRRVVRLKWTQSSIERITIPDAWILSWSLNLTESYKSLSIGTHVYVRIWIC